MLSKSELIKIIKAQKSQMRSQKRGITRERLKKIPIIKNFTLIISGIRRCGKSTLLLQLMQKNKNYNYLNFEDPRLMDFDIKRFEMLEKAFDEVDKSNIYYFDEIQNIKNWEIYVRFLLDNNKLVIVTGSNASLLSRELGTKLTGRNLKIELFPFSFKEFLDFKKIKPSKEALQKYLYLGGFPEYIKTQRDEILQNLLSDVIARDIIVRHNIRNSEALYKLARHLLNNISKEFSYNKMKNMLNLGSVNTVSSFVSYLEESYLIFTLPKFSYSLRQQQVNNKKIFAIDAAFSRVNSLSFSENKGKILENQIFIALKRKDYELFYFQEKGECDFIVKEKNKITKAFQVCYKLDDENMEREVNGLAEAMQKFNLKEGTIITYDNEDEIIKENLKIKVIPAWKWMLE